MNRSGRQGFFPFSPLWRSRKREGFFFLNVLVNASAPLPIPGEVPRRREASSRTGERVFFEK